MSKSLKTILIEIIKNEKAISEEDLLKKLNKEKIEVSENELNSKLLELEVLGIIRTKYGGKSKIIEYVVRA